MPEEVISVRFTARDDGLSAAAQNSTRSLGELQSQMEQVQHTAPLPAAATQQIERLATVANQTTSTINRMNTATAHIAPVGNSATLALGNLSRVAQDAPFGFIGIANNLNPLLESFQRLQVQAGGARGALRALGSSLLGAGGIGFALSAITAILSFASLGFGAWTRGIGSSTKAVDDQVSKLKAAKEALRTYVESLDAVRSATIEASQNAQSDIVNLETLYKATQNANISLADRKKLVDQLQSQYPVYFANVKDEIILAGGAEAAYKKLTNAILAKAKADAFKSRISELSSTDLAFEEQQLDVTQKLYNAQAALNKLRTDNAKAKTNASDPTNSIAVFNISKEADAIERVNNVRKEGEEIQKKRIANQNVLKRLGNELNYIIEQTPDSLISPKAPLPKTTKVPFEFVPVVRNNSLIDRPDVKPIELPVNPKITEPGIGAVNREIAAALQKRIDDFAAVGRRLGDQVGIGFGEVFSDRFREKITAALSSNLPQEALDKLGAQMAAIGTIGAGAASGLADAFGSMTNALLSGQNGLMSFGETLKNTFKQIAIQLVKTIALAAILSLITGGASAAGGKGLSLLGAIGKLSGIPGHAKGTIVPPGYPNDSYLARLTSGEMVVPAGLVNQMRGQASPGLPSNLSGLVNQGGTTINLTGDFRLDADTLRLAMVRAQKKGGRS